MSQHASCRSRISRRCITPFFVGPFQPKLMFSNFFKKCIKLTWKLIHYCMCQLCIFIVISLCFTLNIKIGEESMQRARATNSKYGPVDLLKNENDWEGLQEWLFSEWILADFISVVITSFSNRLLHYDVINSVLITEIRLLCWN